MPLLHIRKQIDYKSTEKRGKWSLNRNNRKNEKIKKKQLTRRKKDAIIAKSLVRQSISTKETKKVLKKCLTSASDCDILDELSLRRQRKITKNLDN